MSLDLCLIFLMPFIYLSTTNKLILYFLVTLVPKDLEFCLVASLFMIFFAHKVLILCLFCRFQPWVYYSWNFFCGSSMRWVSPDWFKFTFLSHLEAPSVQGHFLVLEYLLVTYWGFLIYIYPANLYLWKKYIFFPSQIHLYNLLFAPQFYLEFILCIDPSILITFFI